MSLDAVFGAGVIYIPTPSSRASRWLGSPSHARLSRMGGNQLCIAGDLPVQTCASLESPDALALMRELGVPIASDRRSYRSEVERLRQLREWSDDGWRLALQHAHAPEEVEDRACLVPGKLLAQLNDKACLAEFVPAESVLPRWVARPEEVEETIRRAGGPPVVLKVSTPQTTGGGVANALCLTPADLGAGLERLRGAERLVVEHYLPGLRSHCMGAAVRHDGSVVVLGGALQVITDAGHFAGNRLDPKAPPSRAAFDAVRFVAERAADAGYRGIVGVDVADRPEGGVAVFDLNFRINACTTLLLMAKSLRERFGQQWFHFQGLRGGGTFPQLLRAVEKATGAGWLFPFYLQDTALSESSGDPPAVGSAVPARDEQELEERLEALAKRYDLHA